MTRNEILAMEAGPQLNWLLQTRLQIREPITLDGVIHGNRPLSETWEGMWLIVEAMAKEGWELELRYDGNRAIAGFHRRGVCRRAKRNTAPHAVALAALLAKEGGDAN